MRKKSNRRQLEDEQNSDETRDFFHNFLPLVEGHDRDEIVVCPPLPASTPRSACSKAPTLPSECRTFTGKRKALTRERFRRPCCCASE